LAVAAVQEIVAGIAIDRPAGVADPQHVVERRADQAVDRVVAVAGGVAGVVARRQQVGEHGARRRGVVGERQAAGAVERVGAAASGRYFPAPPYRIAAPAPPYRKWLPALP